MKRRQNGIDANAALSTVDHNDPMSAMASTLPPQPATGGEEDNTDSVAMELGGTSTPKKTGSRRGGSKKSDWTCTAEYERRMGGTPREKPPAPGAVTDDMEPPEYEPWDPADEDDEDENPYPDLIVPDDWSTDFYWAP